MLRWERKESIKILSLTAAAVHQTLDVYREIIDTSFHDRSHKILSFTTSNAEIDVNDLTVNVSIGMAHWRELKMLSFLVNRFILRYKWNSS